MFSSTTHGDFSSRTISTSGTLLVSYLRLNSFEVDAVNDGQAALDYLATRGQPDVVLLDMRLPSRSGAEILESIRGNPSHRDVKVVAMTGAAASEYDIPTGPGGVDGWFSKPLNPPRMIEALREHGHPELKTKPRPDLAAR